MSVQPSDGELSYGEENELLSEGMPARVRRTCRMSRGTLTLASAALCLAGSTACIAAGFAWRGGSDHLGGATPPVFGKKGVAMPTLTARGLLESPELVEVATDQLMQAGVKLYGPERRGSMRARVAEGFSKICKVIQSRHPEEWAKLDSLLIGREQKTALLGGLVHLSDRRVQRVGLDVAHAVRDIVKRRPLATRQEMKAAIIEKLRPRLREIQDLNKELVNPSLSTPGQTSQDDDWDRALGKQNVQLLSTFGDDWDRRLEAESAASQRRLLVTTQPPLPLATAFVPAALPTTTVTPDEAEKEMLIDASGYLSQAENLMEEFKLMLKTFGQDLHLPKIVMSIIDSSTDFLKLGKCELGAAANNMNMVTMAACPLQLGNEGLLAIKNLLVALNIPYEVIPVLGDALADVKGGDDTVDKAGLPKKVVDDKSNEYFH